MRRPHRKNITRENRAMGIDWSAVSAKRKRAAAIIAARFTFVDRTIPYVAGGNTAVSCVFAGIALTVASDVTVIKRHVAYACRWVTENGRTLTVDSTLYRRTAHACCIVAGYGRRWGGCKHGKQDHETRLEHGAFLFFLLLDPICKNILHIAADQKDSLSIQEPDHAA